MNSFIHRFILLNRDSGNKIDCLDSLKLLLQTGSEDVAQRLI
jgi:hypothetical protein